jgi:hypothetical protein
MAHPAIVRDLGVPVALHAKAHLKRFFHYDSVHLGDVAVTFSAIDARLYMRLMTEISKLLQNVNTDPFDRDLIIIMFPQLGDLRIMYDYLAVAKHTGLKRRNSRDIRINSPRMTKDAAYPFFRSVDAMTERYRLLGADAAIKPEGIRQNHIQKQYTGYQRQNNRISEQSAVFRGIRPVLIHPSTDV